MISMAELAPAWFCSEVLVWPNRPPIKTAALATSIAVTIVSFRMDPSRNGRTRRLALGSRRRAGQGSKEGEFKSCSKKESPARCEHTVSGEDLTLLKWPPVLQLER